MSLFSVCVSDVHIGLELGRLIQQIRNERKMSQKDLAAVSRYNCEQIHVSTYLLLSCSPHRRSMRRQWWWWTMSQAVLCPTLRLSLNLREH